MARFGVTKGRNQHWSLIEWAPLCSPDAGAPACLSPSSLAQRSGFHREGKTASLKGTCAAVLCLEPIDAPRGPQAQAPCCGSWTSLFRLLYLLGLFLFLRLSIRSRNSKAIIRLFKQVVTLLPGPSWSGSAFANPPPQLADSYPAHPSVPLRSLASLSVFHSRAQCLPTGSQTAPRSSPWHP